MAVARPAKSSIDLTKVDLKIDGFLFMFGQRSLALKFFTTLTASLFDNEFYVAHHPSLDLTKF